MKKPITIIGTIRGGECRLSPKIYFNSSIEFNLNTFWILQTFIMVYANIYKFTINYFKVNSLIM